MTMAAKRRTTAAKKTRRAAGVGRPARSTRPQSAARSAGTVPRAPSGLTVVGIGASAGGLEALTRLLQHLDPTTGMALVVVQHLAPRHESMLPELLGASAALPVVQVRNGMPLQGGRVHVIPPNVEMTITDGALRLAPRAADGSRYHPIDAFFRSLAERSEGRAVGVVLSGSASDGAIGLREIKAAGGITIAQEPNTAKYDSMPRAAIATGAVDFILSPEHIADELRRLNAHPFLGSSVPDQTNSDAVFGQEHLDQLFDVLRSSSGVDFSHYKLPTIKRRLQRRMLLRRTSQLTDYLSILQKDGDEVRNLYRDILIHVTRFFREPESFDALKKLVFPRLLEDAANRRSVRIWVPGCATGEEAYSIAIALLEHVGPESSGVPIQVFATDVGEEAVDHARLGLYSESIAADVSAERLRRFFTRVDGQYRVSKLVRDSCIFARQDLTRDPPFSKLDLIVCRNVLIYLGPPLQRKLMSVFHYALKEGGFLMLGAAESTGSHSELYSLIDNRHKIFSKRAGHLPVDFEPPRHQIDSRIDADALAKQPAQASTERRAGNLQLEITRALLGRYTPPSVVVDHDFQIVQTRGKTGPFLELATGDPSLNLLKMAREGLLHELRSALLEARKRLKPVRREGVTVRANGGQREIDLQVVPLQTEGEAPYLLVLFESPGPRKTGQPKLVEVKTRRGDRRMERMQQELSSSREYLQSIIQDLEAANEELQSANEEILSSNEELQSTNEELDTAKEELQSTNEELNTVNEELNARNEELSHVNSDLINLLTAVPAAVVIVSSDLKIRRFTPMAEHVLNLIPTDVGRPLSDIKPNLDTNALEELTREVIDSVSSKELEARDRSGRLYSIRIRPYKDLENRINGAVLAFADIGRAPVGDSPELWHAPVRSVVDAVSVGVMVLDDDLRVLVANQPLLRILGVRAESLRDRPWSELALGQLEHPALIGALDRLRAKGEAFSGVTVELPSPARVLQFDGALMALGSSPKATMVLTVREDATHAQSRNRS
jgi:two-component system CheB/CheR fusion protein